MVVNKSFPCVGVMGGGQLGRMMAIAGIPMGIRFKFLSPHPAGPIEHLGEVVIGDWQSPDVLKSFAEGCDVITVESEWAPAEQLAPLLPPAFPLWPAPQTLKIIRDKGIQKSTLKEAGLPVPEFICCHTLEEAHTAARILKYPLLVKRFRGSYDGYGNMTVKNSEELVEAWSALAQEDGALLEAWVPFKSELSVLVARTPDGAHCIYPVAYTEQKDHRCHAVEVPAVLPNDVTSRAKEVALEAVRTVGGVGLTAVELFEMEDGAILINELAPRPHNTGHYSIEGCYASQFENHLRGILNWPLGNPALRQPAATMVNVLGIRESEHVSARGLEKALGVPDTHIHIYAKKSVRPKRKMGHVTSTGNDVKVARARAEQAARFLNL